MVTAMAHVKNRRTNGTDDFEFNCFPAELDDHLLKICLPRSVWSRVNIKRHDTIQLFMDSAPWNLDVLDSSFTNEPDLMTIICQTQNIKKTQKRQNKNKLKEG